MDTNANKTFLHLLLVSNTTGCLVNAKNVTEPLEGEHTVILESFNIKE